MAEKSAPFTIWIHGLYQKIKLSIKSSSAKKGVPANNFNKNLRSRRNYQLIMGGHTDRYNQIETILQNLKEIEDAPINQLINGEISIDTYCNWLVGSRTEK